MGWYGTYCDGDLRSIKETLEKSYNGSFKNGKDEQVSFKILSHSFKFGVSYMAVERTITDKDGLSQEIIVYAVVHLWRYSKKNGEVMVKTIDESSGPVKCFPTKKILKLLTEPPLSDYSHNWRVLAWSQFKGIPEKYKNYIKE